MPHLDTQGLRLLYLQEQETFDPLDQRLSQEHLRVALLCDSNPDIAFKLPNGETTLPPRDYRITFSNLTSIVAIDEEMLPIFDDVHVLEIHLPTGFPVAPAISYMVTPTWHPNIQSDDGPYQGRICGNTEGFGAFYSLDELILRIQAMLKFEIYFSTLKFPYPEDENVARWVREYAEPLGVVRPGIGIVKDNVLPANWRQLIKAERRMKIRIE